MFWTRQPKFPLSYSLLFTAFSSITKQTVESTNESTNESIKRPLSLLSCQVSVRTTLFTYHAPKHFYHRLLYQGCKRPISLHTSIPPFLFTRVIIFVPHVREHKDFC